MNRVIALTLLALAAIPFYLMVPPTGPVARAAEPAPGFAVVELFTSEGCSSCPPADSTLAELTAQARAKGERVIALAWHVDYWDSLGWPDPFADRAHTRRQQAYLKPLGLRRLYTPQVVVNGRVDLVGSQRGALRRAVDEALRTASAIQISAPVQRVDGQIVVEPRLAGAPDGARILVALAESGLSVAVPRGENAGRRLNHAHVVRAFAEQAAGARFTLDLPAGVNPKATEVVVLVQDPQSKAVIAATSTPLDG